METASKPRTWSRSVTEICFLISGVIALFVLLSWIFGFWKIGTFGENYVPMALSTSILMLLLSIVALLNDQTLSVRIGKKITHLSVFIIIFISLWLWLKNRYYFFPSFEEWLLREPNAMKGVQVGRMAPLTALTFIAAGLSLLFQQFPRMSKKPFAYVTIVSGAMVAITGATIFTGYTTGVPLYYDTTTIPMSFFTSIAFFFIGTGLTINSVINSDLIQPDVPLNIPVGAAPKSPRPRLLIGIHVLLVAAICVGGWFYLKRQQVNMRLAVQSDLSAVADLKTQQIVNWRKERVNDARFFFKAAFVSRDVYAFLSDPSSEKNKNELLAWFDLLKAGDRYERVVLFDAQLKQRLEAPSGWNVPDETTRVLLENALKSDDVYISDLHRHEGSDDIHLSILFPVFPPGSNSGDGTSPIGIVMLMLDPRKFLFPLIQRWTSPSETAETLLVRREGDDILFLNELRHRKNTALTFRLPISYFPNLPAVMAALGKEGTVEGKDYRGVPVLAAIRKVPDSPWFLVAKVDKDEIYAPLRKQAIGAGLITVALILITGLGFGFMLRRREAFSLRQMLALELERKALSERVEHLLESANDIILLVAVNGKIMEANARAFETYGYSREELLKMNVADLRSPETRAEVPIRIEQLFADGRAVYETVQCRKNGSLFPIETSNRAIDVGGEKYILAIIRDITQRKEHEKEIERLNRLYATLSQINQAVVRVTSAKELFDQVCRILVEFGGLRMAWIGIPDPNTKTVTIVAEHGDDLSFLQQFKISYEDKPEGQGPTGTAIREKRTVISDDFLNDPKMSVWREAAIEKGISSAAALPVMFEGKIFGTLSIYAPETGFFGEKEINLLEEAAVDVSFALEHLEQEKQRLRAEESSRRHQESVEHLNRVLKAIREINQLIVHERDKEALIRKMCGILIENRGFGCAMIILTDNAGKPTTYAEAGMGEFFEPLAEQIRAGSIPACCVGAGGTDDIFHITEGCVVCADCPLKEACSQKQAMCVRLKHGDETYGYLAVSLDRAFVIDEEEKSLFREMAGDVSFALHNVEREKDMLKAREDKEVAQAQFIQAQKMEAVGRLAGGVAHDFNNMLSVILGYSETALHGLSPSDPLYEDLSEIQDAAKRSANLTRQLLAFSRRQTVVPKVLDINETIRNMQRMLQRIIGEDISLSLNLQPDLWRVMMDPSQIDQIVANLAVNSRDAMPDGGKLLIETKNQVFDDDYLTEHAGFTAGEYVLLAISDTGAGIEKEILEHIFEPFFTTKDEGHGTGLGLSTVYGIAKQNNGFVNVYSETGSGATVKVYLPRHKGQIEEERAAGAEKDILSGSETVLLVEDEERLRRLIKTILEQLGYNVLEANGPGDALIICERYKGKIHLLLTDIVMPTMNGKQLRDRILKIKPDIKTLFMSGYTADAIAQSGVMEKNFHFLQKPFSREALSKKTREAISG